MTQPHNGPYGNRGWNPISWLGHGCWSWCLFPSSCWSLISICLLQLSCQSQRPSLQVNNVPFCWIDIFTDSPVPDTEKLLERLDCLSSIHSFCNAGGFCGLTPGTIWSVVNRHNKKQLGNMIMAQMKESGAFFSFPPPPLRLTMKSKQQLQR